MRIVALNLAITILVGCHRNPDGNSTTKRGASKEFAIHRTGHSRSVTASTISAIEDKNDLSSNGAGMHHDGPSQDTTWSKGLTVGANGPIPKIVVDQFGYRTSAVKVAVIRNPQKGYDSSVHFEPGTRYAVVNKATGTVVKQGVPDIWNNGATDSSSGDKAWWFDFSDVTQPGTYTVMDVDKQVRSVEFEVSDDVYRRVLKHVVRMFSYQRAGFNKSSSTVGREWADAASHLGPGQDSQSHSWLAKTDFSQVKDLRGGWFDAGDF